MNKGVCIFLSFVLLILLVGLIVSIWFLAESVKRYKNNKKPSEAESSENKSSENKSSESFIESLKKSFRNVFKS